MKIGIRTPSIKKSISARTTGRINREIKKSINPMYAKKGFGWINNPKKSAYNKVYNKTTTSVINNIDLITGLIIIVVIVGLVLIIF